MTKKYRPKKPRPYQHGQGASAGEPQPEASAGEGRASRKTPPQRRANAPGAKVETGFAQKSALK
ncbi:MAG: hypothetical protein A3E78_06720 [Alphaproteobacteria bacterium RIFCSPHIGHO2_12_FULL_63_12]|nr:MAG: hypothetical protein A3E78_06720 [Alphaproteobacteria bacterium RIFCSPHIGHO2_12_FULL_63_12]